MNRKTSQFILLSICLVLLTISLPGLVTAAPERRTALVIGNGAYSSSPLKNPVNDAADMASNLKKMGFNVILKTNVPKREMGRAVDDFGKQLKGGDVGLFFYAGHAVQVNGVNYLIPVGAQINEETDVEYEAIDAGRILATMNNAKSKVNIVILDACRDNPYNRSFRSTSRGLAIIAKAPMGTIISYSTSPGDVALDGKGGNSPYTSSLLQYMKEPGITVEQVFKNTRQKITKETEGKQIPWELSSLQGDFFFIPRAAGKSAATGPSRKTAVVREESPVSAATATDDPDNERKKVELEKQRLEKEESLLADRAALEEKRQQLEAKKKQLAMGAQPSVPTANETTRDGRFIAYDNGTVLDTSTNLMWASRDNGGYINWENAKSYCENYRGGGYTGWRMPTQNELVGLYDKAITYKSNCGPDVHLTELIRLTCHAPWASETSGSDAAIFYFDIGLRNWTSPKGHYSSYRALPVRNAR